MSGGGGNFGVSIFVGRYPAKSVPYEIGGRLQAWIVGLSIFVPDLRGMRVILCLAGRGEWKKHVFKGQSRGLSRWEKREKKLKLLFPQLFHQMGGQSTCLFDILN